MTNRSKDDFRDIRIFLRRIQKDGFAMRRKRDHLLEDRNRLNSALRLVEAERDGAYTRRDSARKEIDRLAQSLHTALLERDGALLARRRARRERDNLREELNNFESSLIHVSKERDSIISSLGLPLDTLPATYKWVLEERNDARRERDNAIKEVGRLDSVVALVVTERDTACERESDLRKGRDNLNKAHAYQVDVACQNRKERDSARKERDQARADLANAREMLQDPRKSRVNTPVTRTISDLKEKLTVANLKLLAERQDFSTVHEGRAIAERQLHQYRGATARTLRALSTLAEESPTLVGRLALVKLIDDTHRAIAPKSS